MTRLLNKDVFYLRIIYCNAINSVVDKDDSLQSGLGLLAKYATHAMKQDVSTKKVKRKRVEGACSEQTTDLVANSDVDTAIINETNDNNATACSIASHIKVEGSY